MKEPIIRIAGPDDIEKVARLRIEYLDSVSPDIDPSMRESTYRVNCSYLEEHLGKDCIVTLTEYDGKVVSSAYMNIYMRAGSYRMPDGVFGEIYGVYTSPEYRRRGFAGKTILLAIGEAEKKGVSRFTLDASQSGKSLYEELGFEADEMQYTIMWLYK